MRRYDKIHPSQTSLQPLLSLAKNGAISSKCSFVIPMMICRHAHKLIFTPSRSRDSSCRISDSSTPVQHLLSDSSEQKIYPRSNISLSSLMTLAIWPLPTD